MVHILEQRLNLEFPLGHHLHCLIAQLPNRLSRGDNGFSLVEPDRQWDMISSVLEIAARGEGNFKRLHFLMFPESSVPFARFDQMLETVRERFRPNTVTMFGVEHVRLKVYRELLERFREDNEAAIAFVDRDIDAGDVLEMPVNWCCIAVKETDGKLRVFLEAKSHPFHGEEFLDSFHDLYRGRHFYFFRSRPSCYNFMALICLDYLYRDLYSSNIKQIVDYADKLFFDTRQGLDTLFVIQCNPKPEHQAYRDVLSGFYGEYLEDTPGVRDTVTVFGNSSDETRLEKFPSSPGEYGHSFIVINRRHRLAKVQFSEFSTDDFNGAPICRLRFGSGTRLFYFNLPLHHEIDPRSSRVPLKVHAVMRPSDDGWVRVTGDELVSMFEIGREPE